ncbi:AtpZ/AtpI family protein [bacterium]|nr:AtpZ/AtpI family protein [bacterium]MBU1880781.1 AtpZ/AtpI family protein [bacterium]
MPPPDPPKRKKKYPFLTGFGVGSLPPAFDLALRWGLTLAVSVLLGFFLGRWVDLKLGTTPVFILIGVFWGVGGSFYSLFLQVKQLEKEEDKKSRESEDP